MYRLEPKYLRMQCNALGDVMESLDLILKHRGELDIETLLLNLSSVGSKVDDIHTNIVDVCYALDAYLEMDNPLVGGLTVDEEDALWREVDNAAS